MITPLSDFHNEKINYVTAGCNADHMLVGETAEVCNLIRKQFNICFLQFHHWISPRDAHVFSGMKDRRLFYKFTQFVDGDIITFEVRYACEERYAFENMIEAIFSRGSKRLALKPCSSP